MKEKDVYGRCNNDVELAYSKVGLANTTTTRSKASRAPSKVHSQEQSQQP